MSEQFETNDEISLKELILLVRGYFFEILKYWWIILIVSASFGLIYGLSAFFKNTTYKSSLTFMLNDGSGGSMGGVANLLGSFGFGGGGENNKDKMIELMKSRFIIKKVLSQEEIIGGTKDYFGNHLMRIQEIEVFQDEEKTIPFLFKDFDFKKNQDWRI